MKRKGAFYTLSLLLLSGFAISFPSCKDDEEPVFFNVEGTYGTWKAEEPDEDDGCYQIFEIDDTLLAELEDCGSGVVEYSSYEYTYVDNTFTIDTVLGEVKLKINSLSATRLKCTYYWLGDKYYTKTFVRQ